MTSGVGLRVLRGPNWPGGDGDGGEGHLGTVVAALEGHRVRVLWDVGKEEFTYRAGADGKFDLRVFDSAPVGVQHPGRCCSACEDSKIYGMLWRCKDCRACDLCPLCYVTDKHDIQHTFYRISQPGTEGELMKKRSGSLKIRSMGIFPGATVKRGRDWAWADQDGGPGSLGEVLGFENVAPDSARNVVKVRWPSGKTNSYRLGLHGNVDLTCVEQTAGFYYYREHLPPLSTTGLPTPTQTSSPSPALSDNSAIFAGKSSSTSASSVTSGRGASAGSATSRAEGATTLVVGDKVVIQLGEDGLKEAQLKFGGCTVGMTKCIGKNGVVTSLAPSGAVGIKFDNSKLTFRFNPDALIKIPSLSVGDMVRILPDLEQVKVLNARVGWRSDMKQALGKVGQVTKMDSDGDLVVSFGREAYMFAPACCARVSGTASVDSMSSGSDSGGASDASSSSDSNDDHMALHRDLMRLLAGHWLGGGSGPSPTDALDQLFKAISKGDTPTVRSLCQQHKSLVNDGRKSVTPLIIACHEGHKDVCACLLALGADIDKTDDKGHTPLAAAIKGKKEGIALYLMEKGANPKVKTKQGRNLVHLAAFNNLPETVKVLVQNGADPNAKDQWGDAPLHDAITQESNDAVDMLLRVKTLDLQAQNKKGFNMLQHACIRGNPNAVERILARDAGQVNKTMIGQHTALHIAATNDHAECIKLLVTNGNAEVDCRNQQRLTPLHLSSFKGHVHSVETLLELGASVNLQDGDGDTPLHCVGMPAVDNPGSPRGQHELKQRVRLACTLLSKGAYPNLRNKKGQDALQCCRYSGVRDAIQQFITQNPQVIKKSGVGTPRGAAGGGLGGGGGLGALLAGMTLPCASASCPRMSDITLMPCGHKTLCRHCCLSFSACPLCETTIDKRLHKRGDGDSDLADACRQM